MIHKYARKARFWARFSRLAELKIRI